MAIPTEYTVSSISSGSIGNQSSISQISHILFFLTYNNDVCALGHWPSHASVIA